MTTSTNPRLSVVIIMVGDTLEPRCESQQLAVALESLVPQVTASPTEIIVPYHSRVEGIEDLKKRFPEVLFLFAENLETPGSNGASREHHDELRARAALHARGEVIAFTEDHVRPDKQWCARIIEAHLSNDAAVIGGAIENIVDRSLNWATYFCDLSKYLNPLPKGLSPCASLVNASYKRTALDAIRPTWQQRFNETTVNWALTSQGEKMILAGDIVVYQNRGAVSFKQVWKEFFIWGRSYARTRGQLLGRSRMLYALLAPILPAVLVLRMATRVLQRGRCLGAFIRALPLTTLMTISWSVGELVGYLSSSPRKCGSVVTTGKISDATSLTQ